MIPNHPEEIGDDLQHYELQGETHDVVLAARIAHLYRHDIEVASGGRWYYFDKHRRLWRHDLDKAWVRRAIEITIRHYAV